MKDIRRHELVLLGEMLTNCNVSSSFNVNYLLDSFRGNSKISFIQAFKGRETRVREQVYGG